MVLGWRLGVWSCNWAAYERSGSGDSRMIAIHLLAAPKELSRNIYHVPFSHCRLQLSFIGKCFDRQLASARLPVEVSLQLPRNLSPQTLQSHH